MEVHFEYIWDSMQYNLLNYVEAPGYCKSTIFGRYKIWWIYYILSDNRSFSLYNPI